MLADLPCCLPLEEFLGLTNSAQRIGLLADLRQCPRG